MNKTQLNKLITIIEKLERLQHSPMKREDEEDLMSAKKFLMYALNRND